MNAPVDVLAVLDSLNLADPSQRPELRKAREAIAELLAALEKLPRDVEMVEDNPDEGARYFCCGKPYQHAQFRHPSRPDPNKHEGGAWPCWYPRLVAAVAGTKVAS